MLDLIFTAITYTFERVFQWFTDIMYAVDLDAPYYLLATMFMLFGVKFFIVPFLGGHMGGSDTVKNTKRIQFTHRSDRSTSTSTDIIERL